MLNILFPWGFSNHCGKYTGETPYAGGDTIIIQVAFDGFGASDSLISIIIAANEHGYSDVLGYFMGIMKVACPLLYTEDTFVDERQDVIDFRLSDQACMPAYDYYQDNGMPFVPALIDKIIKNEDDDEDESAVQDNG